MGGGDIADDGVGKEVEVNIRCRNGSEFYVHVNLNSTVEHFKSVIAQKCEIPAQLQRLLYKGRIMKDVQTLKSFGLEDNHTVHLVQGFATPAPLDSTTTTDAGIRNANSTSTNAGFSRRWPLGRLELIPNGSRLGNGSGLFGFPTARELMYEQAMIYNDYRSKTCNFIRERYERLAKFNGMTLPQDNSSDWGPNPLAAPLGAQAGRTGPENTTNSHAPNTNPLPNPWTFASILPEERYATQLSELREMGFFDTKENIWALIAASGDVHTAVKILRAKPSQ